jgi:hypothetical protein
MEKHFVPFVNDKIGGVIFDDVQIQLFKNRMYHQLGLNIDMYLSLIDPDYHPIIDIG